MRRLFFMTLFCTAAVCAAAQNVYTVNAPETPKKIKYGHLDMGGVSPDGGTLEVNSYYMSRDGRPVIPVMGEFHYSRYPADQWEEAVKKMKAGGVTCIPTYVFWALHEPREGEFHWEGDLDVRRFILLCQKHGMDVIVRIGPFCHGEMRQGSIPEWVFAKPMEIRADDPMYLHYVSLLYGEIARQLKGLYYKDGGPIIGCQIENEMQHSASPWAICYPEEPFDYTAASWNAAEAAIGVEGGQKIATGAEAGNEHMRSLHRLATEAGIITPFYTATGWGNAAVLDNKAIPVTSAYTYPTWEKIPVRSPFMLFKDIHANPDYAPVRYKADDFPSFCAEMGAGIQTVYWSRPICTARAAEALMVRTLGSGCNGIGYYMYHGGSTPPRGDLNAFSSDEAVAVPKISYDFQAPVGEFGLEGVSYRNLRLIHSFLDLYQDRLAPMETVLPEGYEKITPDNRDDLRWAVRMKDGSGFVFMVNFQDHDYSRHDQSGTLRINLEKETISIPFTLAVDESLILPFNLDMDGARLRYATAQPLTRVTDGGAPHYIFFAPEGMQPEFVFAGGRKFRPSPGFDGTFTYRGVKVTCLTRSQALDACKVNGRLIITKTTVLPGPDDSVTLLSLGESEVEYTFLNRGKFITATASVGPVTPEYTFDRRTTRHASLRFRYPEDEHCVQEYFLRIPYTADVAMAFMDGVLCQDEFWQGRPWTIGLKRYAERLRSQDMTFYFRPLADMPFLHRDLPEEVLPDFSNGPVCEIGQVEVIPQYLIELKLSNP